MWIMTIQIVRFSICIFSTSLLLKDFSTSRLLKDFMGEIWTIIILLFMVLKSLIKRTKFSSLFSLSSFASGSFILGWHLNSKNQKKNKFKIPHVLYTYWFQHIIWMHSRILMWDKKIKLISFYYLKQAFGILDLDQSCYYNGKKWT